MRKRSVHIKDNSYFHQKDDLINSFVHSSSKMKKLYLNSTLQVPQVLQQPSPELESKTQALRELALKRLQDRKCERESLEQRCHQRTQSTDTELRSVSHKFRRNSFDNYNDLPPSKIKLLINDTVLKLEKQTMQRLGQKLLAEEEVQLEKQTCLTENKTELRNFIQQRRNSIYKLEKKAGVVRVRVGKHYHLPKCTHRINQLASPRSHKKYGPLDYSDTSGLFTRDHRDLIDKMELHTQTSKRSCRPSTSRSTDRNCDQKKHLRDIDLAINITRPAFIK